MSLVEDICAAAEESEIRRYRWIDRGRAPLGFLKGMAVTYGLALRELAAGADAPLAMAVGLGDERRDALALYEPEIDRAGIRTDTAEGRLLALFALMFGLGMRESSGKHCEGRDLSADNITALTAEAGLFQTSFNAVNAAPEVLRPIFDAYRGRTDLQAVFAEGVTCRPSSRVNYGDGDGRAFQELSKVCPRFAVEFAAVALRRLCRHWGPIKRKHAEFRPEAIALLRTVEGIVAAMPAGYFDARPLAAPNPLSPTVQRLVGSALGEWNFFGRSTRSLSNEWHIGGDEADEPYTSRVGRYWRAVGNSGWDGDTPKPWSAALISWLFQNAEVDESVFAPNAGHADYIRHIHNNPGPLSLDPPSTPLRAGYLIWNAREGSVSGHDEAVAKLRAGSFFVSHCDLVVEVGDGWCHSIGGNVSNRDPGGSVTRSTWKLDGGGALADRRKPWIGVVSNQL